MVIQDLPALSVGRELRAYYRSEWLRALDVATDYVELHALVDVHWSHAPSLGSEAHGTGIAIQAG